MKIILFVGVSFLISSFYFLDGEQYLVFRFIKENFEGLEKFYHAHPLQFLTGFSLAFLFLTSFAIPGSLLLTILAGSVFGNFQGVLLVSVLGVIGGASSLLISRYLFRHYMNKKFQAQFQLINEQLKRNPWSTLLSLRLMPFSPFIVVNLVLGLTSVRIGAFCLTTWLGMLPGHIIFVNAGKNLTYINGPQDIMSLQLFISLGLLALLPYLFRKRHYAPNRPGTLS